jgi:hypothetical protein
MREADLLQHTLDEARRTLMGDSDQYESLCRTACQLSALLASISCDMRAFYMLPDSNRENLLCLANDLSMRVEEALLGELS